MACLAFELKGEKAFQEGYIIGTSECCEDVLKAVSQGTRISTLCCNIMTLMVNLGMPLEKSMDVLHVHEDERKELIKRIPESFKELDKRLNGYI